jgi:hypothetical protein
MTPDFAYIYGLFDSRIPDVIWYVGKANHYQTRLIAHKRDAKQAEKKSPVQEWVLRLQAEGIQPKLRVLETCPFSEWKDRERAMISLHRKKNLLLLNKLDGGNGTEVKGRKEFCECGRQRIRLYPTDSSLRCPVCRPQQRRVYEKEWNERRPEYAKSYQHQYYLDNQEKLTADSRRYYSENKDAVRAVNKSRFKKNYVPRGRNQEAVNAKHRARLADPEIRKQISIATKAAMARPDVKARISSAQKLRGEKEFLKTVAWG